VASDPNGNLFNWSQRRRLQGRGKGLRKERSEEECLRETSGEADRSMRTVRESGRGNGAQSRDVVVDEVGEGVVMWGVDED
jgi:hypothetical protein